MTRKQGSDHICGILRCPRELKLIEQAEREHPTRSVQDIPYLKTNPSADPG
jgi:hypothetical protein